MKYELDVTKPGSSFKHFWSTCIGAGRAFEGLRTDWQEQLDLTASECGFRYIRFHGLLCDEMDFFHYKNGEVSYHYTYIDMLFDRLLQIGIRPFVEFGFMPEDLASGSDTQFWWKGNVTPPKDYSLWAAMLSALISHWLERYGEEEVTKWYFEIWNEPNLHAFWTGTKSEYFHLYEVSVKAIKSVCPTLRVGGPATSNFVPDDRFDGETEDFSRHKTHLVKDLQMLNWKGVWLRDFLDFCSGRHLSLDFISTHPYPTDFALDGQQTANHTHAMKGRSRYSGSTKDDLVWIRQLLYESDYPDIEVHLTEWSSSPTSRDYSHDYLPAATYIIKSNLDCIGLTDSLSYWVFTDIFEEAGPGPEAFHGGFGLLTMHGIKKPSYLAYRFLNHLGHELLQRTDCFAMTKDEEGKLRGIFYHYPEELLSTVPIAEYPDHKKAEDIQAIGSALTLQLELTGNRPHAVFLLETLDSNHGNAAALWKEFDYPKNLTRSQQQALLQYAESLEKKELHADSDGTLHLDLTIAPWSIHFLSEC